MSLIEEIRLASRLPGPAKAREIRIKAGVSQERLAKELGVNRMTVARWETGDRRPRAAIAARYSALLEQLCREVG